MARRHYVDNAPSPTFGPVGTSDVSFSLSSATGMPATMPYTATLGPGTASQENVLVTATVGSTVTVTRNYDGLGAFSHPAGEKFQHSAVANDYDEANAHVNATTGVHGVTGAVVGTSDTQTLTNKTFNGFTSTANSGVVGITVTGDNSGHLADFKKSSTIVASIDKDGNFASQGASVTSVTSSGAISGTTVAASSNATVGGTLGVTGASTLASVGVTGNGTVGGTLGVTGATTLHGTTITGAATVSSTLGVSGASTLASVGVTGNATVGGTLGITGATTAAAITASGTVTAPNFAGRSTLTNYANTAARDSAIVSPATGDTVTVAGVPNTYNGTVWMPQLNGTLTNASALSGTYTGQPLKFFTFGGGWVTDTNGDVVILINSAFTGILCCNIGGGNTFEIVAPCRIVSGNLVARVYSGTTLQTSASVALTGLAIGW